MTEGNYKSRIIRFAIPIFIGYLFQQLYSTVDSLIVGNFVGSEALAAVSATASLIYLMLGFFMGFCTGAGVIVARAIGARHDDDTAAAVHTSVTIGALCGLLSTVLGVTLMPQALVWMGTPKAVLAQAQAYTRIYFMGSLPTVLYNMLVSMLQAAGDSRHPLVYLVIGSIVNVALDLLFVAAWGMGVSGASLATVISQAVSMILAWIRLTRERGAIRLKLRSLGLQCDIAVDILKNGFPAGLQMAVIDLSNVLIQSYINSFGAAAMAGIGVAGRIEGFVFLPINAFCIAMTTFTSQNMGARKPERVAEGIRFGVICAAVIIESIGAVILLFAPQLVRAFNADAEVIAYGAGRMRTCGAFYFLMGMTHVCSAIMRGLKRPMVPTVIMLGGWCALRVLVLYTLGRHIHDIRLAYWIYPFTWTVSSAIYFVLMHGLNAEKLRTFYLDNTY